MSIFRVFPRHTKAIAITSAAGCFGGALFYFTATSRTRGPGSLDVHAFTPYTLISKESISSTCALFTLCSPAQSTFDHLFESRVVWSVQIKQPELQIARSYTPLPPQLDDTTKNGSINPSNGDCSELRLMIRKEPHGDVSRYLHDLPIGAEVLVRGPKVEYELPADVRQVLFLAGGTGITTAIQVAHALRGSPGVKMHILWANRKRDDGSVLFKKSGMLERFPLLLHDFRLETDARDLRHDCLIDKQLQALVDGWSQRSDHSLAIKCFIDQDKQYIKRHDIAASIKTLSSEHEQLAGTNFLLLSGPEGFAKFWAGPTPLNDGGTITKYSLDGELSLLDLREWIVSVL